jgi:hypothetical protein
MVTQYALQTFPEIKLATLCFKNRNKKRLKSCIYLQYYKLKANFVALKT